MRKICSLILLIWVVTAWQALAQEVQVTGKVTDATTKETLPGVSITVKGTSQGVVADATGSFKINVPVGSTLVFSYVGYQPQETVVSTSGVIDAALQQAFTNLEEIVVIGYGTVKKADATGSVAVVSAENFNKGSVNSPEDLLTGKAPGVVITSNSGAPGVGSTIRIRGGSSMGASNDPLIVIDGVPVQENIGGAASSLSTINPNDIESYSILKDASATAIYGSRGSNGVILITTKRGGTEFKVNYSVQSTEQTLTKEVPVMTGDQFRALGQSLPMFSGIKNNPKFFGTANTDWQKQIYHSEIEQNHNLNFSGAIAKTTPFRVSLGYTNDPGILLNTAYTRYTAGFSLDPSFFQDHLKVNVNFKFSNEYNNFNDQSAIQDAVMYDPTLPVLNWGDQVNRHYTTWDGVQLGLPGVANPVAKLNFTDNKSVIMRSIGNIQLDYKFHFLPDLHANLNLGYDYHFTQGNNNVRDSASWVYSNGYTANGAGLGQLENYNETGKDKLLTFNLNYSKDLTAIKSRITAMAGYEWSYFYQQNTDSSHTVIGDKQIKPLTNPKEEYYIVSFFGRINYSLLDKYLLTFTVRDDGTSRFSPNNRWGVFPSAALAWKINNESFLKGSNLVSDLKLRLGYGVTGNQEVNGTNYYPYVPTFSLSYPGGYYPIGGSNYNQLIKPNGYDANIKWESTTTYNIALDYGFLKNRITGSFEWYYRPTTDLINSINVPEGTNFTEPVLTNIGSLYNRGYEFSIDAKLIATKDFTWQLAYNVGYNENKITKLFYSSSQNVPELTGPLVEGTTSNYIQANAVGSPVNSFYVLQQVYDKSGNPIEGLYIDRNKDGQINSSDQYLYKHATPDYVMGISSRFNYKNWDFSFSGRVSIGNYNYNNVAELTTYYANVGPINNGYVVNVSNSSNAATKFTTTQYNSDYWIENASFFRMDNISLGYNFSHISSRNYTLHIGATCQNVFVITKYTGLDPEINGGIDNNFYPRPRNFMLGLNFGF